MSSGETVRASTREIGGVARVLFWTKRASLTLTPDEARAVSIALLDQALRAERAVDDSWPDEAPC
ncbi:hypothetical protein [Rathayibacter sp. AY1C9]|uniref:hypothetical protein n=1 Tax=Rathayibacter sp. AY1C9 TaxID=2080541 RepID=UPI0011B0B63D|nr:hypothetical protein [Rathayibacter sp. AY1C9]